MESFNWKQYLLNYPDLKHLKNKFHALRHYNCFGKEEKRSDKKYINGINNVDIVYFINLEHRKDRLDSITDVLKIIDPKKLNRIPAVYNPYRGIAGCTLSHIAVLEKFIESGLNHCIIFEDDFIFVHDLETIESKFNDFFNSEYFTDFDLVMLSGSTMTENPLTPFLTRVLHSQTTSGYLVSKSFANVLLENFKETDILDSNWLKLQPVSKWYSFSPRLGLQREGYSDITHKLENYRL